MLYYLLKLILVVIIILPFYLIIRKPWRHEKKRELALAIFVLFMSGLLTLALEGDYRSPSTMLARASERIRTMNHINLQPFKTIRTFCVHFDFSTFMINIVGNIVMFMPWGFGLALLWRKNQSVIRIVAYAFLLTVFIETFQLFIDRNVDIDDIILNFVGGCLGALLYYILKKKIRQLDELAI